MSNSRNNFNSHNPDKIFLPNAPFYHHHNLSLSSNFNSSSSSYSTPFSNASFFSSPNINSSSKLSFDSLHSFHNNINNSLPSDLPLCTHFSNLNITLFDQHHNSINNNTHSPSFNQTHLPTNKALSFNAPPLSHHSHYFHLPDQTPLSHHFHLPDQTKNHHLHCHHFLPSQQPFHSDHNNDNNTFNVKNPFRFTHPNLNFPPKERPSLIATDLFPPTLQDNTFILQGKDFAKNCIDNAYDSLWGEAPIQAKSFSPICESNANFQQPMMVTLFPFLTEVQGHIYKMAKDQNGCRFLQRMIDEGTFEDLCVVFEGIIDHVVELIMDSFGNYLVQKLLDVCTEDQRLQTVFMLTKVPGQLVHISLNTHGTRVVQKLIETLNAPKQISLVKSAIQPGFLDLIKDLNGNHVIQRCLQCLSCQDNQFILDAAVKFCLDIATHRHGCCVLQRCIDHSVGKQRDKLVNEICKHGLFLAQDPFGNYVVQYIIEVEAPTTSAKLLAQFRGNYVNLSTQKFSSHVVEKCLKYIGDSRPRIVRELLSAPHFEQLLQDPYANYVIQSALSVIKGSLHASLVEAVRPHKILRTSPYCKRIFSGSLLKK